ncbi:hypothetical protein Tco_1270096, partial [Tanacetum coccineum]
MGREGDNIEELDNQGREYESTSFSYRRVAYGGVNGVYYSSSIGQRTGGDGVMLLEMKEEDKTVGQALHT